MAEFNQSDTIAEQLPYLRRYARALTGTQDSGDRYVVATLEALLADDRELTSLPAVRVALFQSFHKIWITSGTPVVADPDHASEVAGLVDERLRDLSPGTREALLLRALEGFTNDEVAEILGVDRDEAEALANIALREIAEQTAGDVLIIEDEAIIAMDLQSIVSSLGHQVMGVARTFRGALSLGRKKRPDLILADIQLADKSSGLDAVNALFEEFEVCPVIFITAFPERLLTGNRPEPAFLISKPYSEEQVRAAIGQAMFFGSTQGLDRIIQA